MAMRSEIFGSCFGVIAVLVEIVNRGVWLCLIEAKAIHVLRC